MKKIVAVLALCITMLVTVGAMAAVTPCAGYTLIPQGTVEADIQARLNAGGKYCLDYTDLDSAALKVPAGKTVELCLHDNLNCRLIEVEANANLTLKNVGSVILNGWVVNRGTLNSDFDSDVIMQKNSDVISGGVYLLQNDNTVVWKNGLIDGPVLNNKLFTMQGGIFYENVVNRFGAEFVMEGGKIIQGGTSNGFVENWDDAKFIMKSENAQADFAFRDFDNGTLEIYAGTVYSKDGKLPAYNMQDYVNHAYIKVLGTIDDFNSKKLVVKLGAPNFGGNTNQGGNGGASVPSNDPISQDTVSTPPKTRLPQE